MHTMAGAPFIFFVSQGVFCKLQFLNDQFSPHIRAARRGIKQPPSLCSVALREHTHIYSSILLSEHVAPSWIFAVIGDAAVNVLGVKTSCSTLGMSLEERTHPVQGPAS